MIKYLVTNITMTTNSCISILMRPKQNNRLSFNAGQYIALSFKNGNKITPVRCFSVVNSENADGTITICARMAGEYTHFLSTLRTDDIAYIDGPFGSFTPNFQLNSPLILIAGGIGVTPMVSILSKLASLDNQPQTTLLYFNSHNNDVPFIDEINKMKLSCPWLKVNIIAGTSENNEMQISQGRFDKSWAQYSKKNGGNNGRYYICGPAGFMSSVEKLLIDQSISPDNIFTESFTSGVKLFKNNHKMLKVSLTIACIAVTISVISFAVINKQNTNNTKTNSSTQNTTTTTTINNSSNYVAPTTSVS